MREILAEITVGEISPGEMLPREVALAERFEVSRGVIRECIRGLEERGVIVVKHGRGATVTTPEHWDVLDPEVLSALLSAPGGDALVADALECQRLLEVQAAGLAAERARGDDVDALTRALERMAAQGARPGATGQRVLEADVEFHHAIVQASGNRALARMSAPLHRALSAATRQRGGSIDVESHAAQHRGIVSAIAAGNAEAARTATADHLASTTQPLRR
jgi:DNA-binding FadR family transcriptional regulator